MSNRMNTGVCETAYKTMSASDQKAFREWIKGILRNETATLTFTKKDGTMRVMQASLREEHMPTYEKKTGRVRTENEEVLSVVDMEKNEWRSFRYDAITLIEFKPGK